MNPYLVISCCLLIVLLGCEHSLQPRLAPNQKIAYISDREGKDDIFIMDADGTNSMNLTNDVNDFYTGASWLRFSRDGSKMVFTLSPDEFIYTMDSDGTNKVRLTQGSRPNFSPDGSKIAFSRLNEIHIMNADGSDEVNLTNHPANDWGTPEFSPDGSQIAFISERAVNADVFVMDIDGSNQTNLTNSPVRDLHPKFSPDGKVAYWSNISKIAIMDRDGSNKKILADGNSPVFSFDGSKIAFNSQDEIHIINSDGTDLNVLAKGQEPRFSPRGAKIVFEYDRDGNYEIYMINIDGSDQINLTNHPAKDFRPLFQPL